VNGASVADTFSGIADGIIAGMDDTLIGGSGPNILASEGSDNTLVGGNGANTLITDGSNGKSPVSFQNARCRVKSGTASHIRESGF
jgi:Ca2+-binding RTX toxin-like protein